jgi:uroporphyrinogen decarboxylase
MSGGSVCKGELCIELPLNRRHQLARELGLDLVGLTTWRDVPTPPGSPVLDAWIAQPDIATYVILDGAFERGCERFGLAGFSALIRKSPTGLSEHITAVEAENLDDIRFLASRGVDGIIIADDVAYQRGLFISPEVYRQAFLPSLARQVEAVRTSGLPCFFHSDGAWMPLVADVAAVGFSGLHCIERSAGMDIHELRRACGVDFWLWGHLDSTHLAQAHDPRLRAEIIADIRHLAAEGAFILGTTSGITCATDLEALTTLYSELSACI